MVINKQKFIRERTGKFLDYYKKGDLLGEGGFGQVMDCYLKKTNEKRAVKIMNKDFLEPEEQLRLIYEIEILRQLDHPNIVRLFEFFEDK